MQCFKEDMCCSSELVVSSMLLVQRQDSMELSLELQEVRVVVRQDFCWWLD